MLLEDNGLLPFLEDWRFFVEPKNKSITVLYSATIFLFTVTLNTLIVNPHIHYICDFFY